MEVEAQEGDPLWLATPNIQHPEPVEQVKNDLGSQIRSVGNEQMDSVERFAEETRQWW